MNRGPSTSDLVQGLPKSWFSWTDFLLGLRRRTILPSTRLSPEATVEHSLATSPTRLQNAPGALRDSSCRATRRATASCAFTRSVRMPHTLLGPCNELLGPNNALIHWSNLSLRTHALQLSQPWNRWVVLSQSTDRGLQLHHPGLGLGHNLVGIPRNSRPHLLCCHWSLRRW